MPKRYEYSVVLGERKTGELKRIIGTLRHQMTGADLLTIERENKADTPYGFVVTNWQLLEVSGTFTYRVLYREAQSLCTPTYGSTLCTLNHKITAGSYEEDMSSFADQLNKLSGGRHYLQIISFQEIPD